MGRRNAAAAAAAPTPTAWFGLVDAVGRRVDPLTPSKAGTDRIRHRQEASLGVFRSFGVQSSAGKESDDLKHGRKKKLGEEATGEPAVAAAAS
jgi:hypothetical protein